MGFFFSIRPPPKLLPVLGRLKLYMTPTLDAALLCSSRAGSDLGRTSDRFEELCQLGFLIPRCYSVEMGRFVPCSFGDAHRTPRHKVELNVSLRRE